MSFFQEFNFDIIVIIIFITSIIFGLYYSFFKQLKKTVSFVCPLLLVTILMPLIMKSLQNKSMYLNLRDKLLKNIDYKNTYSSIIIGIVLYVILYLIFKLIFTFAKPSKEEVLLGNKKISNRLIGAFISIISSYVLVVLLVYFLNPILNIDNNIITEVIMDSSNEIIEISKLNEYQYKNNNDYQKYQQFFTYISGEGVNSSLQHIDNVDKEVENLIVQINEKFSYLSEDSIQLLGHALNDVNQLTIKVNNEYVIDILINNEENNDNFDFISEYRNYIIDNIGYIYLSEVINGSISDDEKITKIIENKSAIIDKFNNNDLYNQLSNEIDQYEFFIINGSKLYSLFEDGTYSFDQYYKEFSTLLNHTSKFKTFINNYINNYQNSNNQMLLNGIEVFNDYLKNEDKFLKIDFDMSFETKLVLSKNYDDWFEDESWSVSPLLRSFVIDALTNDEISNHHLYMEYILFYYLIPNYDINNLFNNEAMNELLTNLNKLSSKFISDEQIEMIVENLFINKTSIIYDLDSKGKVNQEVFDYLIISDNKYISENVKQFVK